MKLALKGLKWSTDYLFTRKAQVMHDKRLFETELPQGSIVGPLIFAILFNDIVLELNQSKILKNMLKVLSYFSQIKIMLKLKGDYVAT